MAVRKNSRKKSSRQPLYSHPYIVGSFIVLTLLLLLNIPVSVSQPDGKVMSSYSIAKGGSENEMENNSGDQNSGSNFPSSGKSNSSNPASVTPTKDSSDDEPDHDLNDDNGVDELEDHDVLEIKNSAGEIKVTSKAKQKTKTEIENKSEKRRLKVKTSTGEAEIELEAEGTKVKIKVRGISASSQLPLTLDNSTGQLFVQTGNGLRLIRVLPDEANSIAQTAGIINQLGTIDLDSNLKESKEEVIFKIKGIKRVKLLGLLPLTENITTQVSANDGRIISTQEPLWARLFSLLLSSG